jgi:lipopolysaccharide/colanic/teichoic acid biosynthesis glycosyltransferase
MTTELLNDLKNAEQLQRPPMPDRLFDLVVDENWVDSKNGTYLKFKYAFESLVAACLLVVLWPVILVLWIAVKVTSPGSGFYTQTRVGLDGKVFKLVKLRSMCCNAEAGGKCKWSGKVDKRVTPLGKVLRKLHLDELPQLWNVACGEMSLVGPRPERPEITFYLEKKIPCYHNRHRVKPGITGLAQVNLEPDENINSTRKKQILDLRYIQKSSMLLDMRLICATSLRVIGIPGAWAMNAALLKQHIEEQELQAIGYEFDTPVEELWSPAKEFK